MDLVGLDVAREPDVAVDCAKTERGEIPARQTFKERDHLLLGDVGGAAGNQDRHAGKIAFDQMIPVAERQPVVGIDVNAPEQILFPGRQRVGRNCTDVGERQQTQQLEVFLGADKFGKARRHLWILCVAAERDLRHLQVFADQELDRFPFVVGQLQSVQGALGQAHALLRVIGFAPFADVVKEQREREQLRGVQLLENRSETAAATGSRLEQRLDVPNRQECVLVDRVLVVEVADHATVNLRELGKHSVQQTAIVHLRQSVVEAGTRGEQPAELKTIAFGGDEIVSAAPVNVLLDAGQRRFGDRALLFERNSEGLEPECRLVAGAIGL